MSHKHRSPGGLAGASVLQFHEFTGQLDSRFAHLLRVVDEFVDLTIDHQGDRFVEGEVFGDLLAVTIDELEVFVAEALDLLGFLLLLLGERGIDPAVAAAEEGLAPTLRTFWATLSRSSTSRTTTPVPATGAFASAGIPAPLTAADAEAAARKPAAVVNRGGCRGRGGKPLGHFGLIVQAAERRLQRVFRFGSAGALVVIPVQAERDAAIATDFAERIETPASLHSMRGEIGGGHSRRPGTRCRG